MDGKIQVIDGVYIVTRAEAVYISDNKTLKQAIDDGSLGGGGTGTGVNFVTSAFMLSGDVLIQQNANDKSITVSLNLDLPLNRIMIVNFSNGTSRQESLPNPFTLQDKQYMVWDAVSGFQIKTQTGGFSIPFNSVLVAINWNGKITGGILFDIYNKRFPLYEKEYSIRFDEKSIGNGKTFHSMFVCDNQLITIEVESLGAGQVFSLPDLNHVKSFNISLIDTNKDLTTSELRLVASDYNQKVRALIMGNSTNNLSEEYMKGYIFYNADTWKDSTETVTFSNCGLFTRLDFTSDIFPAQTMAKMVWAAEDDMCYLTTSNLQFCHKILLGVGTNRLEHGVYDYSADKRYNGTYKIIKTYTQDVPKYGQKDLQFYNGCLWYSIKDTTGGYKIHKSYLCSSGQIKSDLIFYNPIGQNGSPLLTGSPEGIIIYGGKVYCGHATYPFIYSFDAF